ncbi:hypothetical protein C8J56DRAFT_510385 [Mycena floridula]|nr:hypothetical protein C8J56DRAFT_510385 [Mycena floridula]
MTDWNSPETLLSNADSFNKFIHSLFGILAWEWLITLDFDLAFVLGKRNFRWPMLFYFYGRYAMLGGLIGFVFILDVKHEINCQAAYITLQVLGNTALGVASVNLSIRTIAVWGHNRYVIATLVTLILGHFGIILRSIFNAKSTWVEGAGCVTSSTEGTIFAAMYIYAMVLDFIILALTAYKLGYQDRKRHRTALSSLLFRDGLFYFVIAFLANLVAAVFSLMNLNPVMALIADVPATTFATIVSGRVVRRLNNYVNKGPELFSASSSRPTAPSAIPASRGVRVEMTTFTENNVDGPANYRTADHPYAAEEYKTGGIAF